MRIQEHIVRGFLAGNKDAFHALYTVTRKPLYALICKMTGNRHDAEDLLHDVYVRMYEKRETFDSTRSALYTWMYRITVNYTLNSLRDKKRWSQDTVIEDISPDIVAEYTTADERALVQRVLEKMNPDFRVCLVLAEVEQKAYADIAEMLGLSIGTVRSRINRGKAQLKKLFKDHGGEL